MISLAAAPSFGREAPPPIAAQNSGGGGRARPAGSHLGPTGRVEAARGSGVWGARLPRPPPPARAAGAGAAPGCPSHCQVHPPPSFRRAGRIQNPGGRASPSLASTRPRTLPAARRATSREQPGGGLWGPRSPCPPRRSPASRSRPLSARVVARAAAGATYPGQSLLLVQRALGLQR